MNDQNYTQAVCNLARAAWVLSGTINYGSEINIVATEIACDGDGDATTIRNQILDGLRELSDTMHDHGVCTIGGNDCYWWHNNAETKWLVDKPTWWDEDSAFETNCQ